MKVLLAIDGSEGSRAAERVLEQFPFETPPAVRLVHVVPTPNLDSLVSGIPDELSRLMKESRAQGELLLSRAAERCRQWADHVETVFRDGSAAREILHESEASQPDVIAVGARGLGVFSRALLGSVSDRLVKHAPCSVLVARQVDENYRLHRILIADDHSPGAQAAVQRFAALPLGAVRSVKLLRVLPRHMLEMIDGATLPPLGLTGPVAEERAAAQGLLNEEAKRFAQATPNVSIAVENSVDVASTILDTASADRSDLIVVGSQGHNAWERFLVGSVSLRVLHYAHGPVWLERTPRN